MDLTKLVKETPSAIGKSNLMRAIGTIREASCETSLDPNQMRLALNCYRASAKFYQRAIGHYNA